MVIGQYDDSTFFHYTVKEGLSDNYVTSLQQDEWGYLWIGTETGLNRFDGYSFKNFYQANPSLPLLSSIIRKLKLFGPQHLGILGRQGLQLLNTKNLSVRNYLIPDSTAFTNYHNAIWDAQQLSEQSFAITTASGFYVLKNPDEIVLRHDAYKLEDIGKKRILYGRDILPINNKEYIIYTEENGLSYYNAEKRLYREIPGSEKEWEIFRIMPAKAVDVHIRLFPVKKDEFLFIYLRKDSIGFYNHVTKKLVTSPAPFSTQQEITWESKIVTLNDSSFAVTAGTTGFYIFHLNRQTGKIIWDKRKFLPGYKINCLFQDKDNHLWAGTTKGLLQQRFNIAFLKKYFYPPLPVDYSTVGFQNAYRYKNKLYLCRFSRYGGLLILDTATMKMVKRLIFYKSDDPANEISSIEMYHRDTLWLGTNGGILWLDIKTLHYGRVLDPKKYPEFYGGYAFVAPARKDGYAWFCYVLSGVAGRYHIATRTFTFFTPGTHPALPFEKVKSIAYDAYGDVWFAGHSLARWNNQKQDFDTLIKVYGGLNKFNDDILTISADATGSLWLHNAENGLLEYKIKEKKFIPYTINDGLPSMSFQCFSPVVENILWIGTANNLIRFNTQTKKSFVYDYHDGFPDESPVSREIYYDSASRNFYMFGKDYLVKFPFSQKPPTLTSSELLIQEVQINNKKSFFHPADTLRLKYNENTLALHFNIIDFESPNSYQVAYRLNDAETWTSAGQQRVINLNGLPPGKYVLQLKANGKYGEEKIKIITLFISAPFWKTPWFLIGCGFIAGGIVYFLYRRRINVISQKANLDKLLAQTEMKALHAQMNPHFIFNSLNSIREMVLNNETKEASHFLSKFAHLMRVTLDHSSHSFITLRNTMDYLHRYMEMEQIRNEHFTCRILADAELDPDETVLPPMLIQPFIENAIWHGVTRDQKNININIDFKKEKEQLVCIIDDNGIGIDQSLKNKTNGNQSHFSVGISNIRNRIRLLNEKHGLKSSVTIEDKSNVPSYHETGTLVTIRLPLQIAEK